MASFPGTVASFPTRVDGVDTNSAADVNNLGAEVTAVESNLLNGLQFALLPDANNTRDLGSTSKGYAHAYVNNVNGAKVALALAPTDGQLLIGKTSDTSLNLATLTAGTGITVTNAAGAITIAATGGVTVYTPTLANVSNSTTETTVCSFTVTGGTLADGGVVDLTLLQQESDTTAASPTFTYKVYWGGSLVGTWAAHACNSVARKFLSKFAFQRAGTTLYVTTPLLIGGVSAGPYDWATSVQAGSSGTNVLSLSSATFASDAIVAVKVTLSAASANVTYTALAGRAVQY